MAALAAPLLAALLLGAVSPGAIPEPGSEERDLAKIHYSLAVKHYRAGDYAKAVEEFKNSYRLFGDPTLLYNIGEAARRAGLYPDALDAYRTYLARLPAAKDRPDVERWIKEIEALIRAAGPPATVVVLTGEPRAKVEIDERDAGRGAVVEIGGVMPGAHTIRASAEGKGDLSARITIATGERREVRLPLGSLAMPTGPTGPAGRKPLLKRWWFWTAVGVGALAVAAGIAVPVVLLTMPKLPPGDLPDFEL